jgi:cell division protein FtsQ
MSSQATASRPRPVTDATVQLELRRRRTRRMLRTRVAVAAGVVGLLAAAVWLLTFSGAFAAQRVVVSGTETLSFDDVSAAAGVAIGDPLARQDVDAMAERVAALRAVESVQVTRDWPHAVRIAVVERRPVLAVRESGGFNLIDRFGVAYRTVGSVPGGVAVAEVNSADRPLLMQVSNVIQTLPDFLDGKVATVRAGSADSIVLVLTNGDQIIWGSAEQSDLKAKAIVALMKHKASVYDVSAPANPALR